MDRHAIAAAALADFSRFLSPAAPPLTLVPAWDSTWSTADYEARRPNGFPSRMAGVYLLFDDAELLRYVGLATFCFDKRCWTHRTSFEYRYVDVIPIADEFIFLGAALEMYLIRRLQPSSNRNLRGGWKAQRLP